MQLRCLLKSSQYFFIEMENVSGYLKLKQQRVNLINDATFKLPLLVILETALNIILPAEKWLD